jgi:hypothetical protein
MGAVQHVAAAGAGKLALGLWLRLPEAVSLRGRMHRPGRASASSKEEHRKIAVGFLVGAAHLAQVFYAFLAQLGKKLVATQHAFFQLIEVQAAVFYQDAQILEHQALKPCMAKRVRRNPALIAKTATPLFCKCRVFLWLAASLAQGWHAGRPSEKPAP